DGEALREDPDGAAVDPDADGHDGQLRRHLLAVGQLFRHAPDDRLRGARLRPAQARGADRTGDPWHPSGECDGGRAAPRDGDFGRRLDLPLLDTDRARALALRGRRLPRADVPALTDT